MTYQVIPLYYIAKHSWQYYEETPPTLRVLLIIGTVVWFELVFASTAAGIYLVVYTVSQLALLGVVIISAITVRMWQARQLLFQKKGRTIRNLSRFLQYYRESIVQLLKANPLIGKIFFVFLVINCPVNCYLMIFVLFTDADPSVKMANLLVLAIQWLVVFILHLGIVLFNRKITEPNRHLIRLAVHRNYRSILRPGLNRLDIKLNHYIQAFHTKKNYGITYHKYGRVSLMSFLKVSRPNGLSQTH